MAEKTGEIHKRTVRRVRREASAAQIILTVPQVAVLLGKTERATWQDLYRGRLPYRRLGGKIIVLRSELDTFLCELPGVEIRDAIAKASNRDF